MLNELIYFNTMLYDSVRLKGPHGQLIRMQWFWRLWRHVYDVRVVTWRHQ